MNESIRVQQIRSELQELKLTYKYQELFFRKYFNSLRSQINKELTQKLTSQQLAEKKKDLNKVWNQLNEKIDYFEGYYLNTILTDKFINELTAKLNSIETLLKSHDYCLIDSLILNEKEKIERNLFQNKTIVFLVVKDYLNGSYRDLIDGKLLILNDVFISPRDFEEIDSNRSKSNFILTYSIIQSLELDTKLKSKSCIIDENFNFNILKKLSLSGKRITEIHELAFKEFNNLQVLDLSFNHIKTIHENTFRGLINLKQLDLSKNLLTIVNGRIFQGLNKLQSLYLTDNQISNLDENSFKFLISLKQLYLGFNLVRLDELNEEFKYLTNLEKLKLNSNKKNSNNLSFEINENLFKSLKNLMELDLESYDFCDLHLNHNIFKPLNCLKILNLRENKLSESIFERIHSLISLEKLDLKGNQINVLNGINLIIPLQKSILINLKEINLTDNNVNKNDLLILKKQLAKTRKKGINILFHIVVEPKRKKFKKRSVFSKNF